MTNNGESPRLIRTGVSRYLVTPGESIEVSDRAAERLDDDPDFHISGSGSDHLPAAGPTPDLDPVTQGDESADSGDDLDPDGVNDLTA